MHVLSSLEAEIDGTSMPGICTLLGSPHVGCAARYMQTAPISMQFNICSAPFNLHSHICQQSMQVATRADLYDSVLPYTSTSLIL